MTKTFARSFQQVRSIDSSAWYFGSTPQCGRVARTCFGFLRGLIAAGDRYRSPLSIAALALIRNVVALPRRVPVADRLGPSRGTLLPLPESPNHPSIGDPKPHHSPSSSPILLPLPNELLLYTVRTYSKLKIMLLQFKAKTGNRNPKPPNAQMARNILSVCGSDG